MSNQDQFRQSIEEGYTFKGPSFVLGGAMLGEETLTGSLVRIPLGTLNRHGLIAGATGTGKTKTLQILAEQLSKEGVPTLLMDIKGDLSGIAVASDGHPKIDERHAAIGHPFTAGASPVELLTLSDEPGARLRATVVEFGPVLFSKMLDLNDTQSGIVAVAFKYAEENDLPLLDLKDFRKILQWLTGEGKKEIEADYGRISSASTGAIMRKIVELESQGAEQFFGETSFEVEDLTRIDELGRGMVSIIRLTDVQDKPKLFSTFMLQLLAEVYATFPEEGDLDRPKLVVFIDEAHLVFEEATDALLDQLESIIKLIRSKGVGLIFVTQNPADIPSDILGQLGLKVQHALRAFTAKDRKAIKLASENYPITEYYDVDTVLTELGTGEALVTALDRKGRPTPLVRTMLRAPESRMDVLTKSEIKSIVDSSPLVKKYNKEIDRDSAYEMLQKKMDAAAAAEHKAEMEEQKAKAKKTSSRSRRKEKSMLETIMSNTTTRQIGRTVAREFTRGLLGVLGINKRR
ncbi:helicase HerA-like domain-containing protein [Neolewinella agarilytica]|uniref:Helicase HerA-like C-terminal domain-containing protein n=1 Tax=Neolewinella agarilytica TaxID=478744 RepID=A0A1H9GVD1_9BACT|nr:helicase HerA-like domain-containing protein [Neolewinella agarilytica]SEQ53989.1 hypothetical protein SAMN05444359_111121 [Neolewinella agarilytica]